MTKNATWHSKAYHRFFEGYSEHEAYDPVRKKMKIVREYTGFWYEPQNRVRGEKWIYGGLYALSWAVLIGTEVLRQQTGHMLPVMACSMCSILGLLVLSIRMYGILTEGTQLTEGEYKERKGMLPYCRVLSILFFVFAAIRLLCMAAGNQLGSAMDWGGVAGSLVNAVIYLAFWKWEKRLVFHRTQSEDTAPADSYDI